MKLRKWQTECLGAALGKYISGRRHFLCLATPGAGKTTMAAEVTSELLKQNLIDFVLCFSPSVIIARDIRHTLEGRIGERFDGIIGAKGGSFTYQSMQFLDSDIWSLLKSHRVLVVFDEIHHCSGSHPENANSWGEEIITHIQQFASYTLALTGTPWRSDNTPIALAEYTDPENTIVCDYSYGLAEAIADGVCRVPQIVVTDNSDISIQEGDGEAKAFNSFADVLERTDCPYQKIIENEVVLRHVLAQANAKLKAIRKINPSAGGLVVASSVQHATMILNILMHELGQTAVIATYRETEPTSIIGDFKSGSVPWIVSVGMISEGTNIPRLQVCCHLTRIKTELHFRQILGRILRVSNAFNQEACLYMPAESKLIEFAYRVAEGIPYENSVVRFDKALSQKATIKPELPRYSAQSNDSEGDYLVELGQEGLASIDSHVITKNAPSILTQSYDAIINVYGQFKQDILSVSISPFD